MFICIALTSQVRFPGTQTLRQRLVCGRLWKQCYWSKGSRTEWQEEVTCVQKKPPPVSEALGQGDPFRVILNLNKWAGTLHPAIEQSLRVSWEV